MSHSTVTKKPKRTRINSVDLCKKSAEKLREMFGKNTYLGKHDVRHIDPWQILTFNGVGNFKIHASGKSAREVLENANLGGWLEDLERGLIK